MKELEQQRDVLWHGLEMVDRARCWYHRQLQGLCDRQHRGNGRQLDNDYKSDSPNRVNQLLDKIERVNYCLCNFISCAEQGLPPRHCAAVPRGQRRRSREDESDQQRAVASLKRQNHLLTKEVSRKSQWISQLEAERESLVQRLLDTRLQS
ncbi:suppressor APC domain-containing protein 2-like [Leucoraja erinacea]|uniref:suppressor APC domain-containing protein 2-like n=1 Tax=Leucoraja erinaceus TaxID=7782 RepID=UPI0024538082|nr:suppressor APC domain-containing protein 2-like [Leucoraja erinacea]